MDINLNLYQPFSDFISKLKNKYDSRFEMMNGFSNSNLNFTDFIDNFIKSKTVAETTIDANANSTTRDVRTLLADMVKPHTKLISYNKIFKEITKKYGNETAQTWLEGEWNGEFYLHNSACRILFIFHIIQQIRLYHLLLIGNRKNQAQHSIYCTQHHSCSNQPLHSRHETFHKRKRKCHNACPSHLPYANCRYKKRENKSCPGKSL